MNIIFSPNYIFIEGQRTKNTYDMQNVVHICFKMTDTTWQFIHVGI